MHECFCIFEICILFCLKVVFVKVLAGWSPGRWAGMAANGARLRGKGLCPHALWSRSPSGQHLVLRGTEAPSEYCLGQWPCTGSSSSSVPLRPIPPQTHVKGTTVSSCWAISLQTPHWPHLLLPTLSFPWPSSHYLHAFSPCLQPHLLSPSMHLAFTSMLDLHTTPEYSREYPEPKFSV